MNKGEKKVVKKGKRKRLSDLPVKVTFNLRGCLSFLKGLLQVTKGHLLKVIFLCLKDGFFFLNIVFLS